MHTAYNNLVLHRYFKNPVLLSQPRKNKTVLINSNFFLLWLEVQRTTDLKVREVHVVRFS
jgi:hypothetical protein